MQKASDMLMRRTPTRCSATCPATKNPKKTIPDVKQGWRPNAGVCCDRRQHKVPLSLVLSRSMKIALLPDCLRYRFEHQISPTIGSLIPELIFLQSHEP